MKLIFGKEFEPESEAAVYVVPLEGVANSLVILYQGERRGGQEVDPDFFSGKDY